MLRTLYGKLALGLIVLLAFVGLLYTAASFYGARLYLEQVDQSVNRDLARDLVMDRNLVREGRVNEKEVEQTFRDYMTINPSIEIYLLGLDGEILAYSADPGKVKRRRVSLGPIRAFLAGDTPFPLLGDDPRSHDGRKPFSVTAVPTGEAPEGYLYVVLRGERYDSMETLLQDRYLLRQSAWAVAGSLAAGLVVGLVVFHLLTRRLGRLAERMDEFRASDFTEPPPSPGPAHAGGDEVHLLDRTFTAMAGRIVAQIEALREQDTLRRNLVAQVSHDLRTPLAALRGYLETLDLKAGELQETEREEYLRIALKQSERLTRLVSELFELAKLEAREQRPRREPFSMPELAQDVTQKMSLAAQPKDLEISLKVGRDLPLADGDIALIERVLENLVDNAIEHADAGGEIRVGVRAAGSRLAVSVFNSGAAIPASELPHVFERYFRGGRAEARGHAGLGLAIARRIVELHAGQLAVTSDPSAGTTFTFTVPAHAPVARTDRRAPEGSGELRLPARRSGTG